MNEADSAGIQLKHSSLLMTIPFADSVTLCIDKLTVYSLTEKYVTILVHVFFRYFIYLLLNITS